MPSCEPSVHVGHIDWTQRGTRDPAAHPDMVQQHVGQRVRPTVGSVRQNYCKVWQPSSATKSAPNSCEGHKEEFSEEVGPNL